MIFLIAFLPTALGAVEISVSDEAELLSNISIINAAVDSGTAADSYNITVTDDISLTQQIYFHNAHITIQGASGKNIIISRASDFSSGSNVERGLFNAGLLEVAVHSDQTYQQDNASITLKNITFDDFNAGGFKTVTPSGTYDMTIQTPASSNANPSDWQYYIPDSMVSAHFPDAEIILGEGARLINSQSYTVILVTNGAKCIIEDGSIIETKSDFSGKNIIEVHNSYLIFNATLTNITANNFIYAKNHAPADSSAQAVIAEATQYNIDFNGEISGPDVNIDNSVIFSEFGGIINFNGKISDISTKYVVYSSNDHPYNVNYFNIYLIINFRGEVLDSSISESVIFIHKKCQVNFYGNISNNVATHAIYGTDTYSNIILHENSKISNNTINMGAIHVYNYSNVSVYGEISKNKAGTGAGNGGGIYLSGSNGKLFSPGKISDNEVGKSGGGIYLDYNSIFTMDGGTISGNKAAGPYSNDKNSGDYGGGGVSIVQNSRFIMNDGIISNNEAAAGGGVWISGKAINYGPDSASHPPSFIFNGGTVKDNIATDSVSVSYGNDIALVSCNGSGSHLPSLHMSFQAVGGHYVRISKDAAIGEGFIGIAQTDLSDYSKISGYHQAVYPLEKETNNMFIGTLMQAVEDDIVTNCISETSTYTKTDQSLWISLDQTSGNINFVTDFPDSDGYEYLVAVAALRQNLSILNSGNQIEIIQPSILSNGLSIDISVVPGAISYGIIIYKKPFENNSSGGSGSGSAHIATGSGKLIEAPEIKPIIPKPVIPDEPAPMMIKIIQIWMMAIATFVFVILFENKRDEK